MNQWANFFTAMVSASATLAGLIFVGVSISLKQILATPKLPSRALGALVILLSVLLVSGFCLVPGQSYKLLGAELLFVFLSAWIITLLLDVGMLVKTEQRFKKHYRWNIFHTQLALLPGVIGAAFTLCSGRNGIYIMVPGILFCFVKAVVDAWVLLIEIHR